MHFACLLSTTTFGCCEFTHCVEPTLKARPMARQHLTKPNGQAAGSPGQDPCPEPGPSPVGRTRPVVPLVEVFPPATARHRCVTLVQ
jgi:hypothetical protein